MSQYTGIKAKVKIYKEFEDIIASEKPFEAMSKSSDRVMRLISRWSQMDKYGGNIDKWEYDKGTGIFTFASSFNLRYWMDSADFLKECFLPYITEEVIEEAIWDDCDPEEYSNTWLKNYIGRNSREKLISYITEDLEDWIRENEAD